MYDFRFDQIQKYWPALLRGFENTLVLSFASTFLCLLIVAAIYVVRFSVMGKLRPVVDALVRVYIDVVQALPVLVALVWLYFGLPLLGLQISPDSVTVIVLGVSFSAFALDLFMGAEKAISREQIHAGAVHGMTPATIAARIYFPSIVTTTADPLVGQIVTVLKLSTFASIIGSQEILSAANGIISTTYRPLETYSFVALIFVVAIVPINLARRVATHHATQRSDLG
jgi:polar amino acid transport system permease protein